MLQSKNQVLPHIIFNNDFFAGKIDVLVNNGGVKNPYWRNRRTMEDPETTEEWKAYVEMNLTAAFTLS